MATAAAATAACRQRGGSVGEQRVGSTTAAGMAMTAATTCDPSVAAEVRVLMTPGRQGPRAGVGQGPHAPKVEHHVPTVASGPIEGRRNESGRVEEEDAFTMAEAMLSRGGRRWGNCDGEEEEMEEDNNGATLTASRGVGRRNVGFDESSKTPTLWQEAR